MYLFLTPLKIKYIFNTLKNKIISFLMDGWMDGWMGK